MSNFAIESKSWSLGAMVFCKNCGWEMETHPIRSALGHAAKHAKIMDIQ